MYKSENINSSALEKKVIKTVSIFIDSELYKLNGEWQWNMNSDAIYCSDVMSFPLQFEGTKAIIHPDDISGIKEKLILLHRNEKVDLEFRIITTYGKVEKIKGLQVVLTKNDNPILPWFEQFENVTQQNQLINSVLNAELLMILNNYTDKINLAGGWYINVDTLETWYSDNVFRIYGLHPQSLNNHFYTFSNFLHPDDKDAVTSAFEDAFKNKVPLHLDFRIVTANSRVKNIRLNTYWARNKQGQEYLFGLIKDETDQELFRNRVESIEDELFFQKQLVLIDEDEVNIGHWHINILTRKASFSESFLGLFGLKQPLSPVSLNSFIGFIHPDDRQKVSNNFEKIFDGAVTSNMEFRVIRANGKVKYLKLVSKLITLKGDSINIGVLRDITLLRSSEKKLKDFVESGSTNELIIRKLEEFNKSGYWLWNLKNNEIEWSDGIYSLLGYKVRSIELDFKTFLNFVAFEDRQLIQQNISLLKIEEKEISFHFRLLAHGNNKYLKASLRLIRKEDEEIIYAFFTDCSKNEMLKNEIFRFSDLAGAMLRNIKEAIIITDGQNNILAWNAQSEKKFYKRSEDVLYNNLFDLFPFLKTKDIFSGIENTLAGKTTHYSSLNFPSALTNVSWQMVPIKDPVTGENQVLHILLDLSKELNLENTLNKNKSLIQNIVDLSEDKIIALDKNLNYIIWNQKCEEYFKVKKANVIGRNILEFFPKSIDRPTYSEFKSALNGETIYMDILMNKSNSESIRIYLVPLEEKGSITGLIWIIKNGSTSTILSDVQLA